MPELLSKEDVARALGVSVQTVHRLIKSGELQTQKIGPRFVRITKSELERYLNSNVSERK
jgi:excisionase family DNA binding protein